MTGKTDAVEDLLARIRTGECDLVRVTAVGSAGASDERKCQKSQKLQ
jgi:hypothetical protein